MARLQAHDWPGNIRELRNVLDRARLFADDGIIRAEHMPLEFGVGTATRPRLPSIAPSVRSQASTGDEPLAEAVATFRGTRRELAVHLGMSERTLYRRLQALGLV